MATVNSRLPYNFIPTYSSYAAITPDIYRYFLLVRVRLLPEDVAADVHGRVRLDGAIAADGALTGEPHFVFVADRREHA